MSGDSPLAPVKNGFFKESLRIFGFGLTCCHLEHEGMSACDRQPLVTLLLGLYGVLLCVSHEVGGKKEAIDTVIPANAIVGEIERRQEDIAPRTLQRTMWRKSHRLTKEVTLFGQLTDRMKARLMSGAGFAIDEEATVNATLTKTGSLIRGSSRGSSRSIIVDGSSRNILVDSSSRNVLVKGSSRSLLVHGPSLVTKNPVQIASAIRILEAVLMVSEEAHRASEV